VYILCILVSAFLDEVFNSLGKREVRRHRESIYELGFIAAAGSVVACLLLGVFTGFQFQAASLPTMAVRVVLDIIQLVVALRALAITDRSTFAFYALLTVPLLVVADFALGFGITALQAVGVLGITVLLFATLHEKTFRTKGAPLLIAMAVLNAATVSLFKFNVAHFNNVAAEQSLVTGVTLVFFWVMCRRSGYAQPWRIVLGPREGAQSAVKGASQVLKSLAFSLAPGSVVTVIGQSFGIIFSLVFGKAVFRERHVRRKAVAGVAACIALLALSL
jgi:hypothetical protein